MINFTAGMENDGKNLKRNNQWLYICE